MAGPAPTVRPGRPDDLAAIDAIEQRVFDADQLPRRALRRFLQVPTTDTAVALPDSAGSPVGYAMIGFRQGSRIGRIFTLAVLPEAGGRGLGAALLAACEAAAWRRGRTIVQLEVRADNAKAIALYERTGYRAFGRYEDYYEDGGAALRYAKQHPDAASPMHGAR